MSSPARQILSSQPVNMFKDPPRCRYITQVINIFFGIHLIFILAYNAVFPLLCNIAVRLHVHSNAGHRLDLCRHTPSHTGFVHVAVQSQSVFWLDILCPPKYVDIKNQWRARPLILFLCPQSTLHNSSLDTKTHATHP